MRKLDAIEFTTAQLGRAAQPQRGRPKVALSSALVAGMLLVETEVVVDGTSFVLSHSEDLAALRSAIVDAVSTAGQFIDMRSVDGSAVTVLVGPRSRVMFITHKAAVDSTDLVIRVPEQSDPNAML